MKNQFILLAALAASTLSLTPVSQAEPPSKADKRAQLVALLNDPELSKVACDRMMKDRDSKRYMAKSVARDNEARSFYGAEVGTSAPHQERNPSEHPELFQIKK